MRTMNISDRIRIAANKNPLLQVALRMLVENLDGIRNVSSPFGNMKVPTFTMSLDEMNGLIDEIKQAIGIETEDDQRAFNQWLNAGGAKTIVDSFPKSAPFTAISTGAGGEGVSNRVGAGNSRYDSRPPYRINWLRSGLVIALLSISILFSAVRFLDAWENRTPLKTTIADIYSGAVPPGRWVEVSGVLDKSVPHALELVVRTKVRKSNPGSTAPGPQVEVSNLSMFNLLLEPDDEWLKRMEMFFSQHPEFMNLKDEQVQAMKPEAVVKVHEELIKYAQDIMDITKISPERFILVRDFVSSSEKPASEINPAIDFEKLSESVKLYKNDTQKITDFTNEMKRTSEARDRLFSSAETINKEALKVLEKAEKYDPPYLSLELIEPIEPREFVPPEARSALYLALPGDPKSEAEYRSSLQLYKNVVGRYNKEVDRRNNRIEQRNKDIFIKDIQNIRGLIEQNKSNLVAGSVVSGIVNRTMQEVKEKYEKEILKGKDVWYQIDIDRRPDYSVFWITPILILLLLAYVIYLVIRTRNRDGNI